MKPSKCALALLASLLPLALLAASGCYTAILLEGPPFDSGTPDRAVRDVAQPDAGSSDAAFSVDSSEGDATPSDAAPDASEPSDASDSGPDADF